MLISSLAKELSVKSKDITDFFSVKGINKNAMSKLDAEEEQIVRNHFLKASPEISKNKKEPEKIDDPKKTVSTMIRRKGERSFVPEEQRKETDSTEFFTEKFMAEQKELAEETAAAEKLEAQNAIETPAPVPEEEFRPEDLILPGSRRHQEVVHEEKTDSESHEFKRGEEKKKEILEDDEELDANGVKKKKKKIIMMPETEAEIAKKKLPQKTVKTAKKSVYEKDAFKGKIKSADITMFSEDGFQGGKFGGKKRKDRRNKLQPKPQQIVNPTKAIKKIIKIEDTIILSELAHRMSLKPASLIKKMIELGEIVNINDRISFENAQILSEEFGFQVENVALNDEYFVDAHEDTEDELVTRPPVVTVMGHVDHGKTKLLDAIRNTNVVDREAGGITQHIGAYTVQLEGGEITFLDTPGHEAFTGMRSRGAKVTDVVVLVVAADDGVMPQTVEAINHAKAAGVPIIVAINKIDKPDANPDRVRQELLKYEIVGEEWGGENLFVEISAKQHLNIDKLLESILLQVEMMDLKANPDKLASGVVIESRMDLGKGPIATTLVQEGTLKVGDLVVVGTTMGYIRSMIDWVGKKTLNATPSMAVEITGLDSVPSAGDKLYAFKDEKKAKGLIEIRKNKQKAEKFEKEKKVSLENLFATIEEGELIDLNIIVKGDVDGSVEAINQSLGKLEHEKIKVRTIHSGVGGITENDVLLAAASNAIIIGFNVRIDNKAKQIASAEQIEIKIYSIIYDLIAQVKAAMSGLLAPIVTEEFIGKVEIRQLFRVPKAGTVAGCMVTEGRVTRKAKIKLVRNNIVIYEGTLNTLKRFKDDVKEVKQGYECGMGIDNYNDLKEGDIIEFYESRETADEVK